MIREYKLQQNHNNTVQRDEDGDEDDDGNDNVNDDGNSKIMMIRMNVV